MLVNGSKHESVIKSTPGLANVEEDDEATSHSLKIAVDESSKDAEGKVEDQSILDVDGIDGDNNNNVKSHEVKDNVVIVNQNSSKCLLLKIKSGKVYKDEQSQGMFLSGTW